MATVKLYAHLACGRPATASNAASRIAWSYDGAGRPTNETAVTPLGTSSLSQQLDASGLPTNTHLNVESCALSVERSFDPAARLTTQTTEAGAFAWSYTPWNGLPAAVTNLDSGLAVAYEYDVLDRVTSIHWLDADGATLRRFGYVFDAAGNITNLLMEGEALPSRATAYGYDRLDRLTAETAPGRTNAWSYDLADNRTNATHNGAATAYTLGIGDRLASTSDGVSYLYNAAGCVTTISSVVSLSWNAQYQLTTAYTNGAPAESYQYDALGRRIATTSGGTTTYHVYDDNWQVLADLDASGQPLRSYTWAPGIDRLLAMTTYDDGVTNTYYALTDHLGTVHALVDASGFIVESYEFDAWGNVLAVYDASGVLLSTSSLGNRYLFQGREYSFASGLYNFRGRWYDPATGRWMSNDPIGISGGLNQYVFCGNIPINFIDPWGLCEEYAREAGRVVDEAIANSTLWQALRGMAGRNVDQDLRYIDTEKLKTIDLQHVVSSAVGPPGSPTIGGLMVEINQMIHDKPSAIKTEDIISNVLGGVARDKASERNTSIGQQVENIIKNAGPKGPPYGRD